MGWLVFSVVLAVAIPLGAIAYAGSRMGRLPAENPAAVLAAGGPPSERPVVVCLGDSITQGGLGADWVGQLRQRLDGAFVVNAGTGGAVTWDLRQRLDEVARCRPAAIVLLVGSNDAVGTLGGGWTSFYEKGRPQAPSEAWFAEQYDALVKELVALPARLVCLTLPPLGEEPSSTAEGIVRRNNEAIRKVASDHGADLLDLHAATLGLQTEDGSAPGAPFLSGIPKFMTWALGSNLRHHLLGQSWDDIARRRGLSLTTDTIHPNDRSAAAMVDLVAPWVEGVLDPANGGRSDQAS
jgi:lysophospholipase L1-like esterase